MYSLNIYYSFYIRVIFSKDVLRLYFRLILCIDLFYFLQLKREKRKRKEKRSEIKQIREEKEGDKRRREKRKKRRERL